MKILVISKGISNTSKVVKQMIDNNLQIIVEREVRKMKHYFTITKTMTYDLDEIMRNKHCDYETAIEIAYNYFDEAEAEAYEESEEEDD